MIPTVMWGEISGHLQLYVDELLTPSTVLALFAAFGAAFFGSRTAHALGKREQESAAIRDELRAIDAALSMCFAVANAYLGFKSQLVRPTALEFENERAALERFWELRRKGRGPAVFSWKADLQSFPPLQSPAGSLSELVVTKIGIRGRGFDAVQRLVNAEQLLRSACSGREAATALISQELDEETKISRYFGLPMKDGSVDVRFKRSLEGIVAYTDDCIFFPYIAAEDLRAYEAAVRARADKLLSRRLPKRTAGDWSEAQLKGLIPSQEKYASWLRGFVQHPTSWQRVKHWLRRLLRLPWFY